VRILKAPYCAEAAVLDVHLKCERLIDATEDALRSELTAQDDDKDTPAARDEARDNLTRALRAARSLMGHLEAGYEFSESGTASASPKEGICE